MEAVTQHSPEINDLRESEAASVLGVMAVDAAIRRAAYDEQHQVAQPRTASQHLLSMHTQYDELRDNFYYGQLHVDLVRFAVVHRGSEAAEFLSEARSTIDLILDKNLQGRVPNSVVRFAIMLFPDQQSTAVDAVGRLADTIARGRTEYDSATLKDKLIDICKIIQFEQTRDEIFDYTDTNASS